MVESAKDSDDKRHVLARRGLTQVYDRHFGRPFKYAKLTPQTNYEWELTRDNYKYFRVPWFKVSPLFHGDSYRPGNFGDAPAFQFLEVEWDFKANPPYFGQAKPEFIIVPVNPLAEGSYWVLDDSKMSG